MKTLKDGQEKIQEICDVLRRETLEPAHTEARSVIEEAKAKAHKIISDAESQAEQLHLNAKKTIEQERNVFKTALEQASVQSLEALRQDIEGHLFNTELNRVLNEQTTKPDVIAKLITVIIDAIEKEGIGADLSSSIAKSVSADDVNRLLSEGILKKLQGNSVVVGNFSGGARVQVHDKKLTIDISDEALRELLTTYVRKDFRKIIFAATS